MRIYNKKDVMRRNKVVFLTINWRLDRSIYSVDTSMPPACFPIEWSYLANGSYETIILDEYGQDRDIEVTLELISSAFPDVVVVSTTPSYLYWRCPPLNLDLVFEYIGQIKCLIPSACVITIGPHGTIDPEWILSSSSSDYVFRGEPDGNLNQYLETLDFDDCSWLSSRRHIKGIAPERDFDLIGSCDYSSLPLAKYQIHAWGLRAQSKLQSQVGGMSAMVELARGCPYSCAYCFRTGFRRSLRSKSLKSFEEEIIQLSKFNVGYVFFIDETFGMDWNLYLKACEFLYRFRIKFGLQSRPDILDPRRLSRLKELGCVYIEFGLESNEKELSDRTDKFDNFEKAKANVEAAKRIISIVNVNILDLGNEDYFDRKSAIPQFDNEGNAPPPLIPYPTTILGEKAISKYRHLFHNMPKWVLAELIFLCHSYEAGLIDGVDIENTCSSSMIRQIAVAKNANRCAARKSARPMTRFMRLFQGSLKSNISPNKGVVDLA